MIENSRLFFCEIVQKYPKSLVGITLSQQKLLQELEKRVRLHRLWKK